MSARILAVDQCADASDSMWRANRSTLRNSSRALAQASGLVLKLPEALLTD